jgi:hypothetical protein
MADFSRPNKLTNFTAAQRTKNILSELAAKA